MLTAKHLIVPKPPVKYGGGEGTLHKNYFFFRNSKLSDLATSNLAYI
jgi:hypothetical protein